MNETTPITEASKTPVSFDQISRIWRKYYYITLIASLLGAAVQMLLLLSEYDVSIGMYRQNAPLATVFYIFALVATAGILTMPLVLRRRAPYEALDALPAADTPLTFSTTLCGFILIAVLILQVWAGMSLRMRSLSDYFWIAVLVLTLPTALHFLLPILPLKVSDKVTQALAFFPVLWCLCYLMSVYFDNSTAIQSPVRILTELAMIASTLFFLSELRIRVGKPTSVSLLTCINISIFFSALCAIPQISVAFINQWVLKTDLLYSAVQLCFLTYFIARANTLARK